MTERNPEEKLFVYILINAIEDVMVHQSDRKSSLIKCEAHNWLISMNDDFCSICEYGLLNPIMIHGSYLQAVKDRKIKFTQRQIQWNMYHNTYNTFKKSNMPIKPELPKTPPANPLILGPAYFLSFISSLKRS